MAVPNRGIISVGTLSIDRYLLVDQFPSADEKVRASDLGAYGGGSAPNFALAARLTGCPARLLVTAGGESVIDSFIDDLRRHGVEVWVTRDRHRTSWWCVITLDRQGEHTLISVRTDLSFPPLGERGWPAGDGHLVYVTTSVPEWTYRIARQARRSGNLVALDLGTPGGDDWSPGSVGATLMSVADVVLVTAGALRSMGLVDMYDARKRVRELGPQIALVSDGPGDAHLLAPEGVMRLAPARRPVRDTTGAGDAVFGAFCGMLARGHPIDRCFTEGMTISCLCTMRIGAREYAAASDAERNSVRAALQVHRE